MKDRTSQESPDPAEGERPEDASWRGTVSAHRGGEHRVAQVEPDEWMERVLDPVNMEMAWTAPAAIAAHLKCEATPQIVPQGG
jgi:hypothetical protein